MAQATATKVGQLAPELELPDTHGTVHTLPAAGEAPATVVVWTCNHCPYALGWHDRLVQAARDYEARGVRFLAVNSNDAERYPHDSLDAMRERVEPRTGRFRTSTTKARMPRSGLGRPGHPAPLRARRRPAGPLRGRRPTPTTWTRRARPAWLREALDAVLAGEEPARAATEPVGCSIKWKQ